MVHSDFTNWNIYHQQTKVRNTVAESYIEAVWCSDNCFGAIHNETKEILQTHVSLSNRLQMETFF
jgi:hypothetical protein